MALDEGLDHGTGDVAAQLAVAGLRGDGLLVAAQRGRPVREGELLARREGAVGRVPGRHDELVLGRVQLVGGVGDLAQHVHLRRAGRLVVPEHGVAVLEVVHEVLHRAACPRRCRACGRPRSAGRSAARGRRDGGVLHLGGRGAVRAGTDVRAVVLGRVGGHRAAGRGGSRRAEGRDGHVGLLLAGVERGVGDDGTEDQQQDHAAGDDLQPGPALARLLLLLHLRDACLALLADLLLGHVRSSCRGWCSGGWWPPAAGLPGDGRECTWASSGGPVLSAPWSTLCG